MKANAPEKIYLQENTTTDCYEEWWPEWFEARAKDSDIEYVRKDAFIEKAAEWLDNRGCLYIQYSEGGTSFNNKQFIEDFKKAMNL